jgi:regulatory protein
MAWSTHSEAAPPDFEGARTIVLNSLNQAPRTRKQLEDLLTRRGVDEATGTAVLDRFVEVGLVDDTTFAENWVRSRHMNRGVGRPVLRQELRRKGVQDEVIQRALELVDEQAEYSAAAMLVNRKLNSMRHLDHATKVRRLSSMLMRRGYGPSVARAVVSEVLDSEAFDDGESC